MILERIPGSRMSRVLPAWRGRTVAIIGGGASIKPDHFERLRVARDADRVRVIAINDSYLLAPWADVHYAADAKWHRWHTAGIAKPLIGLTAAEVAKRWAEFPGQKCTVQEVLDERVHVLRNITHPNHATGISTDPTGLYTGRHGGFQCVNVSILAGGVTLLLLGFDARRPTEGASHWHGEHPSGCDPSVYEHMRRAFSAAESAIAAAGVRVVNCSLISAIDTFPKMELDEALEEALA